MDKNDDEDHEEKLPERPIECSECKKPIAVKYTEIIGNTITRTSMCQDCPELQRRLQGASLTLQGVKSSQPTGLACGNCGTTLEAVRVGNLLGCSDCYEVFSDILLGEMLSAEKIPPRLAITKKSIPIHIGRAPGEIQEMNPSLRLLALNEALNETLKREEYEQAAWLRDQIKALTDKTEVSDDHK
ncbi:MAG: UvrB/UvrC motif-containing protein [Parachlamydiaceae bacterium]|nr:UvrB/UvrC motif-containing protein [Parachlamydiaceae bacterium]